MKKELHICEDCLWACSNCDGDCSEMTFLSDEHFENVVLPKLREENELRTEMWMEEDLDDLSEAYYYSTAINSALEDIRNGEIVYLYNLREIRDVLSFEPNINVILNDGIYYCSLIK